MSKNSTKIVLGVIAVSVCCGAVAVAVYMFWPWPSTANNKQADSTADNKQANSIEDNKQADDTLVASTVPYGEHIQVHISIYLITFA
jgi:flagellar basal body-associated protein FliL